MIVSENRIYQNLNQYDVIDQSLISSKDFTRNFGYDNDYVEVHIYTLSGTLVYSIYNFKDYKIPPTLKAGAVTTTNKLEFSPGKLLEDLGFIVGTYRVVYNVLRKRIINSGEKEFFIKEISADRTELRISTNTVSNNTINDGVLNLINEIQTVTYFKDYLLNFGDNKLLNAVNLALDKNTNPYSILVKLYRPLPTEFVLKDSFWFSEELATPVTFQVELFPEVLKSPTPMLKSANFDIDLDVKGNSSSEYFSNDKLLLNSSSFSYQQVQNKLNDKGIQVNVDYSDYSNFVHYSSALRRLINFINKVEAIENYTSQIDIIKSSPSYIPTGSMSQSAYTIQKSIDDIVVNFDPYENYLYYESSSATWPKSNSTKPYTLYSTTSVEAYTWVGSLDYNSPYYGGQSDVANVYDEDNPDNLVNSIPEYIRIDATNIKYDRFIEMIGQHFDNVWVYAKAISEQYNTTNNIAKGISKDLVYYALRSLGIKLYNSKSNDDLYNFLVGANTSGSYAPTSDGFSTLISASNSTTPGQDLQKELLKRIYHNTSNLLKKKGTSDGIDDLITIFGVPSTILSPMGFGGSDKTSKTVEYTYDRFSYALHNTGSNVQIAWDALYEPTQGSGTYYVPDTLEFRFKPAESSYYQTSSLVEIVLSGSDVRNVGVIVSPNSTLGYPYSNISMYISGALGMKSSSMSLPLYHNDDSGDVSWWNIMVGRQYHKSNLQNLQSQVYNMVVSNKIDTRIGHIASASISIPSGAGAVSYNLSWARKNQTLYLGGSGLPTSFPFSSSYKFSGSLQEFRYWSTPLSESAFYYHVLNPESIEGNVMGDSYNKLCARFPLGNNLVTYNHTVTPRVGSTHPNYNYRVFDSVAVSQSALFNSFPNTVNYLTNQEQYVADSPNSVYANPVNNKVRIVDNEITGSVLSPFLRMEDESNTYFTKDVHFLDVSFSPQNEINKDIIAQYGSTFDIDQYIGDPRQGAEKTYKDLNAIKEAYFKKYIDSYDFKDYVRLIQFFDNSLFKMIADFTPGRDNLNTGITIKSPILERPKEKTPVASLDTVNLNLESDITGSHIQGDSNYVSGNGNGSDFYSGELEGAVIDINNIFDTKNANPYLWG